MHPMIKGGQESCRALGELMAKALSLPNYNPLWKIRRWPMARLERNRR
jgi:hypothetical protein